MMITHWMQIVAALGASVLLVTLVGCGQADAPGDGELVLDTGGDERVTARLLPDTRVIVPGAGMHIGVLLEIKSGWHVYWTNPGESGQPTTVDVVLPEGFEKRPTLYPVPKYFEDAGGISGNGYENQVLLLVPVVAARDIDSTAIDIEAKVSWLVCKDVCIPGEVTLTGSIPVASEKAGANMAVYRKWMPQVPTDRFPAGVTIDTADANTTGITLDWAEHVSNVELFTEEDPAISVESAAVDHEGMRTRLTVVLKRYAGQEPRDGEFDLTLAYDNASGERRGGRLSIVVPD